MLKANLSAMCGIMNELYSALGTRGSVYSHQVDTLTWRLGLKDINTRNMLVKDMALHGAREASRALRA
jgi:hypothetical protein